MFFCGVQHRRTPAPPKGWQEALSTALHERRAWLHGIAPSWLPWRPRVITWVSQSLAAVVEAGGLRDGEKIAEAALEIWTVDVGRMRYYQIFDWLRRVATRLCDDGILSACTAIVPHGSLSTGSARSVKRWSVAIKMKHLECFSPISQQCRHVICLPSRTKLSMV